MSITSDVEIRLRADIAQLRQDMTQARNAVNSTMDNIRAAVGGAAKALAGLAAGLAVGAFANWIKGAIDAVDAIGDISPATGVAIKDIAGLQMAFQFGGVEAKEMEKTMIKLSSSIAAGDKSFNRIGVATKTATGQLRESTAVLYDVADRFANLEDGTAKTALATELFGKTGASLIPMLNNGSEGLREMAEMADKLGLTFNEQTVEAAGQFNDTLDFMALAGQGVARQLAAELLPSLNSVSGSFLKLIVDGNGVRKTADVISTGFKVIYTGAVAVSQVFDTLSSVIAISLGAVMDGFGTVAKTLKLFIEREYTKAWEAANAGARATVSNAKNLGGDMVKSWSASATAISDVWTGAGAGLVAGMAATQKKTGAISAEMDKTAKDAAAAAKKAADDQARAAEQNIKAYAQLIDSVQERIYATNREANGLAVLTESQKIERDLDRDLAAGKITLTEAQKDYYRSLINTLSVNERLVESNKLMKDSADEQRKALADAAEARNRDREDAAATELAAQKDLWASIDKTAHDTFISIADGGKGAAERLKDTFKNVFFDWLYQQTIKKWVIDIQPTATGGGGLMDQASQMFSNSGGGASGLLQAGKAIYQGFTKGFASSFGSMISKFGSTFGSTAIQSFGAGMSGTAGAGATGAAGAGSSAAAAMPIVGAVVAGMMANNKFFSEGWRIDGQVTDIIKSQMKSMFKGNGFAPIISVMTASMNVFEKAMSKLGVNAKFASMLSGSAVFARAFGHKAPAIESQGIQGTISAGGFSGEAFANILQKGGWFRSDKRSTQKQALDSTQDQAFDESILSVAKAVRGMGEVLGIEASRIDGYSKQIKITLTNDEAKNKELIEAAFGGLADDLATLMLPTVAKFAVAGETASATLERVAGNFQTVSAMLSGLGVTSQQAFGAVGVASIEARERLVSLAGGVEALAQQADFFAANFLTDAQRLAPVQKLVTEQLAALGYAGLTTTEQFRDAVTGLAASGALASEAGAKTYAGLLALAPAFKTVADASVAAKKAAEELALANATAAAEAAQAAADLAEETRRALVDGLRGAASAAFDALQSAVEAQKGRLQKSFDDLMTRFDTRIADSNAKISNLQSLRSALGGAASAMTPMDRQQGQAQIASALAIARASGYLPKADDLQDALRAVQQDSTNQFSSLVDFQRDQLRTANQIQELAGITDTQLTVEQRTLQALVDQKTLMQSLYNMEVDRLDALVLSARSQLEAINGNTTAIFSLQVALQQFSTAAGAALGNSSIGGQASVTAETRVEGLYNSLLGRASDASGLKFWADALRGGTSMSDVEKGFLESQEYQNRYSGIYTAQQGGTMSGGSVVGQLETLNKRMEEMSGAMMTTAKNTGQTTQLLDDATAGGNAMRIENANV